MRHGTLESGAPVGRWAARVWLLAGLLAGALPACGEELWKMSGPLLAHDNSDGVDVLHGAVKPQDDTSSATLYFKFTVDPLSDVSVDIDTPYQAGLTFYERGKERLGVGNGLAPHAYGAFNVATQGLVWAPMTRIVGKNDYDFNFQPEAAVERPRRGILRTIVVEVQFVPHGDDQVTVWLQPDLAPGNSKLSQQAGHVTRFKANCSFDEVRLIHRGGGEGWEFSNLAVATSFDDFVELRFWHRWWVIALSALILSGGIAAVVVLRERALARHRIRRAESEQAVVQERTRIAQDIHDELGSSLAQIGWLADLGGGGELSGSGAAEARGSFATIAQRARAAVAALDEIVWAVNPHNDNLQQLADYIGRLVDECSQSGRTRCRKEIPDTLPPVAIRAELRHNLTLVVKEALANTLQHAGAASLWLRLKWEAPDLEIVVEDDGCGFDPVTTHEMGNGLRNQRARMAKIGGEVDVRSAVGQGTSTRIRLRLAPDASPPARGAGRKFSSPPEARPVMKQTIRIAMVEDNAGARATLRKLFASADDFLVTAVCPNAETALKQIPAAGCDVVLMDINLPGMNGIDCLRALKARMPGVSVVMLTAYDDNEKLFGSLLAGADGYLLKRLARAPLLEAVREIVTGGAPISPTMARRMVDYFHRLKDMQAVPDPAPAAPESDVDVEYLSAREKDLLRLLADGLSLKEAAAEMNLSWQTARSYTKKIYQKLHVHSRTDAVLKYLGHG